MASQLNIAFSINNNYANHLIVALYSLFKHNKHLHVHVHILSSDLSSVSKEAVTRLVSNFKLVKVSYHNVDVKDFKDMAITMDYISLETYYRLRLADILPDGIEKVLYLDADILITGDVGKIFEASLNNYYVAGVPDIYLDNDHDYKKFINTSLYINAGVMLLNLSLIRRDKLTETLIKAATNAEHRYQDQDAVNRVMSGKIFALERRYNYQIKDKQYNEIPEADLAVLHYSGSLKPWNRDRIYDEFSALYDQHKLEAAKIVAESNPHVKYGLLKYSTDNVGDSIQGIAARKFLPQIDYFFERDNMDATKTSPGETVKVIINGWWGDGPENWPPLDQNLDVLPISMYVEDRIQKEFQKPRSKMVLNFFGPVGARSRGTKKFLSGIGVDSYFSGCLTLTLNAEKSVKKRDFVLAVDVSDEVYNTMIEQTERKVIRLGVLRPLTNNIEEQYKMAELYLYLYQSAHAIVTTRLHTMLPSIALGTPVLFLNDILGHDDVRFSGLSELAHNLSSADYIAAPQDFSLDKPPKNKQDYLRIRKELEQRCQAFTGHMGTNGYFRHTSLESMPTDPDLIQALVGGYSEAGDLKEASDKLQVILGHKENHIKEVIAELGILKDAQKKLQADYANMEQSLSWRMTSPVRHVVQKVNKGHKDK